jgi:hypothetical protein
MLAAISAAMRVNRRYCRPGILPANPARRSASAIASPLAGAGLPAPERVSAARRRFFRSRWGDPGGCCGGARLRGFIEPQRQRDPAAFWVDFQHLDTDDIAGLRNCARVFDVSIGHRGDVHQPVLVDPHIGRRRRTRRHSSRPSRTMPGFKSSSFSHSLAKACHLENRARIMPGFLEFLQDVGGRSARQRWHR